MRASRIASMLALVVFALPAAAVEAGGEGESATDVFSVSTLDEVVVTGRLGSLSGLRKALIEAEDRFYERWNVLNDDDRLDVQCRTEAPTGHRLYQRKCNARVLDDYTREQALALFNSTGGNLRTRSEGDLRQDVARELTARTLRMLDADPELRLALLQRARLQQLYDDLRAKKLDGRRMAWD